jgi:hypothetical protein
LAISSTPLDNTLSFSDTARRVEFIDLRVALTTVICSFGSFRKSICSFYKLEIFSALYEPSLPSMVPKSILLIPPIKLKTPLLKHK